MKLGTRKNKNIMELKKEFSYFILLESFPGLIKKIKFK